jgi:hypothetical protein
MPIPHDVMVELQEIRERLDSAEARITGLELNQSNKPGRRPDEIAVKVVEFLKSHPGLKLNSGSIAGNVKVDTKIVSGRLKTLVGRGVIKAEKLDDLSAMYWYEEKREDES